MSFKCGNHCGVTTQITKVSEQMPHDSPRAPQARSVRLLGSSIISEKYRTTANLPLVDPVRRVRRGCSLFHLQATILSVTAVSVASLFPRRNDIAWFSEEFGKVGLKRGNGSDEWNGYTVRQNRSRGHSTSRLEPFSSRRGKNPQEGAPMRNVTINNTNTPINLDITVDGILAGGVVAGCVTHCVKRLYRLCKRLGQMPALLQSGSSSQRSAWQWFRSHMHAEPATAMPAAECLAARPFAIAHS